MAVASTYWQKTRRLTVALLLVWFAVTFVLNWFAHDLNAINFFGFPFGFYLAAQGEMFIYLLIIWFYNRRMNALDVEFGIDDE